MKRTFFRTLYISLVVAFCLIFGIFFAAKAYENINETGFAQNKKAIEINDGFLYIFDFKVPLSQLPLYRDNRS